MDKKFIVQPTPHWYESIPQLDPQKTPKPLTSEILSSLTANASLLHASDIRTFNASSSNSSSSEASFLHKILQSGTLSDRLSALTLLVQSSPLHNSKALENLKGMAEKGKGRDDCLKALRCIVDWWVGGGAPARKLKYFRDQPLCHPSVTDKHLLLWHFEDWLKKYFFSILQILESLSLDPLSYVRTQSLTLIFTLLRDKPEQEQNLLRLLVNKLGDNEKALCSRASYHLLQLLQTHPAMKAVIVREVIALVLRPSTGTALTNATRGTAKHTRSSGSGKKKQKYSRKEAKPAGGNMHARYYATITFNQIVLTPGDREVALQLIHVYFEMFKELLGEGKEERKAEDESVHEGEPKMDRSGRVRVGGKGKAKSRLKEVKGAAGFAEVEDAHSKLISAILTGVNRALPFAKIDSGDSRLKRHIDTLFFITHTSTFNTSLQALVLIQQVSASLSTSSSSFEAKLVIDRYYRTLYASMHDPRLSTSSKQAMYLNLLFKSIKADPDKTRERVKAIIRRFVQVLVSGGSGSTEFVAGGLFLLGELFGAVPGLRTMLNAGGSSEKTVDENATVVGYDPRKREPEYARASSSPLWELIPLLGHYHPAISLHTRQLILGQPLTASADLSLTTLSHFLDRFVYKNPKKVESNQKGKGGSAMQPAANASDGTNVKLVKGKVGSSEAAVNEEEFFRKKAGDVPVDLLFFHRFFATKREKEKAKSAKAEKRKRRGRGDKEEDGEEGEEDEEDSEEEEDRTADEDDESDENEAEIWKAMKASMPPAAGDDDLMDSDSDEDALTSHSEDENEGGDDINAFAENSDDEDLMPLEGEGVIEYDGSSDDETDEIRGNGKKRKRESGEERRKKKKKRSLPTFASYEEYAKMIEVE